MQARMYALKAGAKLKAKPSGQALRVLRELQRVREPRLATEIDDAIAASTGKPGSETGPHITRQTSLRVTLYYLLVFKKAGAVEALEPTAHDVDTEFVVDPAPVGDADDADDNADANDADELEGAPDAEETVTE